MSRIHWVVKVLLVGLALTSLCAAEDGNQPAAPGAAANGHPRILRVSDRGRQLSAPRQLRAEQPASVITGASSVDDFDGMERTLASYQSGVETMSLRQIQSVWPDLDRRRLSAFKDVFEFLRATPGAPRFDLECAAPAVVEPTVTVECRQALTYLREDRKPKTVGPAPVTIAMKKQSNAWVIQSMKGH